MERLVLGIAEPSHWRYNLLQSTIRSLYFTVSVRPNMHKSASDVNVSDSVKSLKETNKIFKSRLNDIKDILHKRMQQLKLKGNRVKPLTNRSYTHLTINSNRNLQQR